MSEGLADKLTRWVARSFTFVWVSFLLVGVVGIPLAVFFHKHYLPSPRQSAIEIFFEKEDGRENRQIAYILEHGLDPNEIALTHDGYRPIHAAAKSNKAGAIEQLVNAGADVNLPTYDVGSGSALALDIACHFSAEEAVVVLIRSGAVRNRNHLWNWEGQPASDLCRDPDMEWPEGLPRQVTLKLTDRLDD